MTVQSKKKNFLQILKSRANGALHKYARRYIFLNGSVLNICSGSQKLTWTVETKLSRHLGELEDVGYHSICSDSIELSLCS